MKTNAQLLEDYYAQALAKADQYQAAGLPVAEAVRRLRDSNYLSPSSMSGKIYERAVARVIHEKGWAPKPPPPPHPSLF